MNTQLLQLNTTTRLVTITAGGNNLGFGDIVTNCGSANPDLAAACNKATTTAMGLLFSGQLASDVASMIRSVQAAAPKAKIVVTGYPYLFDPIPVGLTDSMPQFIYQATFLADQLNEKIADAAGATNTEAHRVQYVDVRTAFAGHGIISDDPWINGVTGNADSFHPNAKGYEAYYRALSAEEAYSAP